MDPQTSKKVKSMNKHSFGHYRTERQAVHARNELQKEYPTKKIQVVREKRKRNTWPQFCVCEFIPERGNKGQKKSNKGKKRKATSRSALDITTKGVTKKSNDAHREGK